MNEIINYIRRYFYEADKMVLATTSVFMSFFIFLNYYLGLDKTISKENYFWIKLFSRYCILLAAFGLPWLLYYLADQKKYDGQFLFLLLLAPAIFAFKMAFLSAINFSHDINWNNYWNYIVYWPLLLIITASISLIVWKIFDKDQPFYGTTLKNINWKPYWFMLLIMVPLIGLAASQPDFQAMYPKLKTIESLSQAEGIQWWHKLLFELSYGSDFISIELFFRGFLVLAFVKWAGKDAILPMACFYCAIHFGKPLGECISSYLGGLLLGIIIYNTRSIWGGLLVHVGIAWLMEIAGYLVSLSIR